MMLRSLVDEVVRRRLWPIPLVAILVAIAAPLLFMKGAPDSAPAATDTPAAAAPGTLPVSARKLLTSSDKAATPHKRSNRPHQDPFAPPASAAKAAKEQASVAKTAPAPAKQKAIPVVITNSDGSKAPSAPKTTTTTSTQPAPTKTTTPVTKVVTFVDARFGKRQGTMIRYRVPRLQTFRARGMVAAMFLKYSPTRHKAVFVVAASTKVAGDVKCREVKGVCHYVDIPVGSYARLSMRAPDGSIMSRRLDVVRVRHMPATANATPSARSTSLTAANCLLKGLLSLPSSALSIAADACA